MRHYWILKYTGGGVDPDRPACGRDLGRRPLNLRGQIRGDSGHRVKDSLYLRRGLPTGGREDEFKVIRAIV